MRGRLPLPLIPSPKGRGKVKNMQSFKTFTGLLTLLDRGNVDTDQIISKEHLKSIRRTGFGPALFSDWRYQNDGSPNPQFPLNQPHYQGATILVTGNNFGCGSSREHAVWALQQYGFRTILAPRQGNIPTFADIFANNSGKNGLLLIEMSETEVNEIKKTIQENEGLQATVNLADQTLTLQLAPPKNYRFTIDSALKERLLKGLDDIGRSEQYETAITQFEKTHSPQL